MTKKAIQFLLKQLATNKQDRKRFNKNIFDIECLNIDSRAYLRQRPIETIFYDIFERFNILMQAEIIRTCLRLVNGEAVLGVFKKELDIEYFAKGLYRQQEKYFLSDLLYFVFDEPLRNGKTLDEAIQALHDKMLELVPEYQEFIKNNK